MPVKVRWARHTGPQPRLLPGEEILYSKEPIWYLAHRLRPWQFGENHPIPLLLGLSFHVTNMRACTTFRHCGLVNVEISQWRRSAGPPDAAEFITDVRTGDRHFGSVRFDFFGLGKERFGTCKTRFGPDGEHVPYLEIVSRKPGKAQPRCVQVYLGPGLTAAKEIEAARDLLLDGAHKVARASRP